MIVKEELHRIADELEPTATVDDVIDRLLLLQKVETGLKQADEGKVVPHEEVVRRVGEWLR